MPYAGVWFNDRGASMHIDPLSDDLFRGHYQPNNDTPEADPTALHILTGSAARSTDTRPNDSTPRPHGSREYSREHACDIGWFVTWINQDSDPVATTTWSGQYECRDGQETITATWYQFSDTVVPDWSTTRTGVDTFTRHSPTDDTIAAAHRAGPASHPD